MKRGSRAEGGRGQVWLQIRRPDLERSVIFTADDFGLARRLNGAVVLAHRHGLLSVRQPDGRRPSAQAALNLARDLPGLCLGVHLTLIQGRAVPAPEVSAPPG